MWRATERCLFILGLVALGYWLHLGLKAAWSQTRADYELSHQLEQRTAGKSSPSTSPGAAIGRLEIARLGLSTVMFEGADADVLERGAGHVPGSAMPGDRGNTVVAAHRDTFFRSLRNVRTGDVVRIRAPLHDSVYVVESTAVVDPDDTFVMAPTGAAALTLITCYPFGYIGPAPERFIVRAVLAR